jgi:hypothetical protein
MQRNVQSPTTTSHDCQNQRSKPCWSAFFFHIKWIVYYEFWSNFGNFYSSESWAEPVDFLSWQLLPCTALSVERFFLQKKVLRNVTWVHYLISKLLQIVSWNDFILSDLKSSSLTENGFEQCFQTRQRFWNASLWRWPSSFKESDKTRITYVFNRITSYLWDLVWSPYTYLVLGKKGTSQT